MFSSDVLDALVADARARAPLEACGLFGAAGDGVRLAIPLTNADASPDRFRLLPEEQFQAARLFRARGLVLAGVYHSHPRGPACPSEPDREQAHGVPLFQMIVSLDGERHRICLFEPEYRREIPVIVL